MVFKKILLFLSMSVLGHQAQIAYADPTSKPGQSSYGGSGLDTVTEDKVFQSFWEASAKREPLKRLIRNGAPFLPDGTGSVKDFRFLIGLREQIRPGFHFARAGEPIKVTEKDSALMPLKGAAYTLHETYKTYRDLVAKPALSPEESLTRAKVRNILVNDAGEPEVRDIDKLLTIR